MLERSESELRAGQDVQRKTCKLIGSAGLCSRIAVRAKHDASAWVEQPPPAGTETALLLPLQKTKHSSLLKMSFIPKFYALPYEDLNSVPTT